MWTDENFNPGALKDLPDSRDLSFGAILEDIGADNAPSWEEGYDVEQLYGKLVQKDQNGSLSCTAQATSYYGELLARAESGTDLPFSARAIYSEIYFTQGGAYIRDAIAQAVSTGFTPEENCPSYPNDETSMRQKPSSDALALAAVHKEKSYASVGQTMEQFRQALFSGKGLVTGFTGSNPSWQIDKDGFIRPPAVTDNRWGHCVFIVAYGIHNGRKGFKIKNSWGSLWGEGGYAWVGEDYFTAENNSLVFSGWTLVTLSQKYNPEYMFNLLKVDGNSNVYAVSANKKHLIVNLDSFKAGISDGLWSEQINSVTQSDLDALAEGQAIVLINNN